MKRLLLCLFLLASCKKDEQPTPTSAGMPDATCIEAWNRYGSFAFCVRDNSTFFCSGGVCLEIGHVSHAEVCEAPPAGQ